MDILAGAFKDIFAEGKQTLKGLSQLDQLFSTKANIQKLSGIN
jgi:hypothetical protein